MHWTIRVGCIFHHLSNALKWCLAIYVRDENAKVRAMCICSKSIQNGFDVLVGALSKVIAEMEYCFEWRDPSALYVFGIWLGLHPELADELVRLQVFSEGGNLWIWHELKYDRKIEKRVWVYIMRVGGFHVLSFDLWWFGFGQPQPLLLSFLKTQPVHDSCCVV